MTKLPITIYIQNNWKQILFFFIFFCQKHLPKPYYIKTQDLWVSISVSISRLKLQKSWFQSQYQESTFKSLNSSLNVKTQKITKNSNFNKTPNLTKLKNSKCDKTQKQKCDKPQKLKIKKKTQQQQKTKNVTKKKCDTIQNLECEEEKNRKSKMWQNL